MEHKLNMEHKSRMFDLAIENQRERSIRFKAIFSVCDRKSGSGSGRSGLFFQIRFRSCSSPDRICLSPSKNVFLNLGVGFVIV